ncbi:MAG: WD40 repeat domain-containing protein, partial [Proteobacteria bacterium]|nr:WD40 repeat domain-containing protein [Pseudomonadota bacterium]
MNSTKNWDWDEEKKLIADIGEWKSRYQWIEEPYVSPDGEKIATVVKFPDDEVFTICENGTLWESSFDKVWYPRFSPDGKLTALVSETGEWSLAVDGQASEEKFEFVWDTRFSPDGRNIIYLAQTERKYFAVINGVPWKTGFPSLTGLTVSNDGDRTAAAVQTVPFKEAEIFKFQEGCYSVAVDGTAWDRNFVNVWDTSFSPDGKRVAAGVRTSLYDYTVAVDGVPWEKSFASVWEPQLCPSDDSVTAPVRSSGSWFLAKDGKI